MRSSRCRRILAAAVILCASGCGHLPAPVSSRCLDTLAPGSGEAVVVTAVPGAEPFRADLRLFARSPRGWEQQGETVAALVGRNGIAPPGEKREGDGRTPGGVFPLERSFGYEPFGAGLPFIPATTDTIWIDDPKSPSYNRLSTREEGAGFSFEEMLRPDDLYRYGIVVEYNTKEPVPGLGSAIFFHVQGGPDRATAGCVAAAQEEIVALARRLDPEKKPVTVIGGEHLCAAADADLVEVTPAATGVAVEMRYARSDNFTGHTVYDCGRCFLRRDAAEKLARAQGELEKQGLGLKMWDCYRPLSVQKIFWALVPDPRYVADPKTGSRHNRGNAVDLTLVDAVGRELPMPTPFDDFTDKAAHGATDLPAEAVANRETLAAAMEKAGFRRLPSEWWHYDDSDGGGEILDVPFSALCGGPAR